MRPSKEIKAPAEIGQQIYHRGRHEADLISEHRSHAHIYAYKKKLINQKQNPVMYPGDFIRYVIELQNFPQIKPDGTERLPYEPPVDHMRYVSELLGYAPGYIRGKIFNGSLNTGLFLLPQSLQEKMAAITRTPIEHWQKHNYYATDAEGIVIDPTIDISKVIEKHANEGGAVTRQRNRNARLDEVMRGL